MSKKITTIGGQALLEGIMMSAPSAPWPPSAARKGKFPPRKSPAPASPKIPHPGQALHPGIFSSSTPSAWATRPSPSPRTRSPRTPARKRSPASWTSGSPTTWGISSPASSWASPGCWGWPWPSSCSSCCPRCSSTCWRARSRRTSPAGAPCSRAFCASPSSWLRGAGVPGADIHRTFQYHGAEHKTIFCYENDLPLTVENVRKQGRFHPRCGTSFLTLMLLLGIIVGFFIPFSNPFLRTFAKLLCIPSL